MKKKRENIMNKAINIIIALILSVMCITGSVLLKHSALISESSFILLLVCSVLLGLFIAYSDRIAVIDFLKLQLVLREIKDTETSVRELAKAVLNVIETSSHALMLETFDSEAKDKAIEKLKKLTT